jgi:hypothetical protein
MSGTKSAAARKRPNKPAVQPAPPIADPELLGIMKEMADKVVRPDGSLDAVAVLTGVHGILGPEKYANFEAELTDYFAPDGIAEVFVATWDYGWTGKLQTICGFIGAAAVLVGICEVAGRVLDVPGLQFGTKLAGLILGD